MDAITPNTLPEKDMLPEASKALTFSIWGNALSFTFMIPILGIAACIVALVLSIKGLSLGRNGMELYKNNKQKYHGGSFAKTLIAFILGIVGIVQSAILSLYAVFFTIMILMGEKIF